MQLGSILYRLETGSSDALFGEARLDLKRAERRCAEAWANYAGFVAGDSSPERDAKLEVLLAHIADVEEVQAQALESLCQEIRSIQRTIRRLDQIYRAVLIGCGVVAGSLQLGSCERAVARPRAEFVARRRNDSMLACRDEGRRSDAAARTAGDVWRNSAGASRRSELRPVIAYGETDASLAGRRRQEGCPRPHARLAGGGFRRRCG